MSVPWQSLHGHDEERVKSHTLTRVVELFFVVSWVDGIGLAEGFVRGV